MEFLLLFGMVINVILLFYLASKSTKGLKLLLYSLSGYWFLSFIIRPSMFIYSRDQNIDSIVYDSRIGQSSSNFISVMSLIVIGCFVFCIPIIIKLLVATTSSKQMSNSNNRDNSKEIIWVILFGLSCGIIAFLIEGSSFRNPISKSLTSLITISLSIFLWKRRELILSKKLSFTIIIIGSLSTLLLSISTNNSKGILLTPVLIYIATLTIWNEKGFTIKKFSVVALIAAVGIPVFSKLQTIKLGIATTTTAKNNYELFPWYLSPFLEIANRFDQFARVTDSYFAESGTFGGLQSWITYILKSLEWNPGSGRSETSFGQVWNQLITAQTIPGARLSSVSLAQGMIAEGYVWIGFWSLILECFMLSAVFICIGRCLEKRALYLIFAFGLIGNGTILEMGVIQAVTTFSGTMKILFFIWFSKRIWFSNLKHNSF
jgi:hypothetical protein